jgi:hypothetical protein
VADSRDADPDFSKRMAALQSSLHQAKADLERHERKFDPQWFVPRGYWMETGRSPLPIAEGNETRCGSRAVSELESGAMYAIQVVMRQTVYCVRTKGHPGVHCSEVRPHQFRKARWQAYVWKDAEPPKS